MTTNSRPTTRITRTACGLALPLVAAAFLLVLSAQADKSPEPPTSTIAQQLNPALTLYDRAMPGIIEVLVNDHLNGSGWIADREGHVITAAHVVVGKDRRIEILSRDLGRIEAKLVALDLGNDLALLRLPPRDGGYPFLPLAQKTPVAGTDIFVLGAPIYRHHVMLKGTVARNAPAFEYLPDQRSYISTIHVAASTPRGTSGGPWLSTAGEVVGLQSGMMRDDNAPVGIAFAIPTEPILFLLNTKTSAATPTLDAAVEEIWEQPWDFLKKFPPKTEGVVVRQFDANGPTGKAGIAQLDVIVAINDQPIRLRDEFLRIIRAGKPGDELTLKTLRAGIEAPRIVKVKLDKMEKN